MLEQGSNTTEEEAVDMMTVQEVARMTAWLRAKGMSDKDILDCQTYIATGIGLPDNEPNDAKESE